MPFFHKHLFKERGTSIWCECGKVKHIPCSHDWEEKTRISVESILTKAEQTVSNQVCKKCGAFAQVNLVNGNVKLTSPHDYDS